MMILAHLALLNPLWIWGTLAAVGVPLLAHLLSRHRGRLVVFPAARFVAQAAADAARLWRPRHWLLLMLRVMLLLTVVAAFVRPVWHSPAAFAHGDRPRHVVMLLDVSASMARTHHGASLFDEARRQVVSALGTLESSRDRAAVVLIGSSPRSLLPEMTGNLPLLIDELHRVEVTEQRGEVESAARLGALLAGVAADRLGPSSPPRQLQFHLFSDMQTTQWPDRSWSIAEIDAAAELFLHPVGTSQDNAALHRPRVQPAEPTVAQQTIVSADVANYGGQPVHLVVEFTFAGQVQRVPAMLDASGRTTVSVAIRPTQPGPAQVSVRLAGSGDALASDDRVGLSFHVNAARRLALVSDRHSDDPATASFFVKRALLAAEGTENTWVSPVRLQTLNPQNLTALLRSSRSAGDDPMPTILLLVEAGRLSTDRLHALNDFLHAGGSALWVIDSSDAAEALINFDALADGGGLSPIAGGQWHRDESSRLAFGRFEDPALRVFEGAARAGLLGATFQGTLRGSSAPHARTLLQFEDDSPALALGPVGQGQLAVLGADLTPQQADLVKHPLFVPLLHEVISTLAPDSPPVPRIHPGDRPDVLVPGHWTAAQLSVRDPHGQALGIEAAELELDRTRLHLNMVPHVGPYTVEQVDHRRLVGAFDVELDSRESDLATTDASDQTQAVAASTAEATRVIGTVELRSQPVELWPWFVAMALVLAAAEPLVVMICGRGLTDGGGGHE
jgi:hypothetical protein